MPARAARLWAAPVVSSLVRNAVVLGLVTAIAPFAIDMYLPAPPVVAAGLGADAAGALSSMTVFFITFALGQLSMQYDLSSLQYSAAFSVNAVAFFAAMQFNGALGQRFGLPAVIRPAVLGHAVVMALLLALVASGSDGLPVLRPSVHRPRLPRRRFAGVVGARTRAARRYRALHQV